MIKSVQRGVVTLAGTIATNITISPVDMTKAFVNLPYRSFDSTSNGSYSVYINATLTSNTNLQFSGSTSNTSKNVRWEVIEFS